MTDVRRLDEVCEIIMGQAPNGEAYNNDGIGWPLIAGAGDFGETTPQPKKFTTESSKLSRAGDVIIGIRATIGEQVIADGEYCLGRGVAALRASMPLEARFLWHWLTHTKLQLAGKARGATFKQVSKKDIGELQIDLPALKVQRRIVDILDQADALRTQRLAALAQLDTLTQAIFLDMFGDPVTNTRGWPNKKLVDVGSLDRGVSKHRPRNAPELIGGPYPLVQTGDVANCEGYIRTYNSTYSDIGLQQSKMWPSGTLCITIAANIAKTGILTFDACFPDSVVGFHSIDPSTIEYVRIWLSFLQKRLEETAPESAQKNINLAILRELDIPFPPLAFQHEFAHRIAATEKLKTAHRVSLVKMDELFASLQYRAFQGEL